MSRGPICYNGVCVNPGDPGGAGPICIPVDVLSSSGSGDGQCVPGNSGDLPCAGSCSCDASPSPNSSGCSDCGGTSYANTDWSISITCDVYEEGQLQPGFFTGFPVALERAHSISGGVVITYTVTYTGSSVNPPSCVGLSILASAAYAYGVPGGGTADNGLGDPAIPGTSSTGSSSGTHVMPLPVQSGSSSFSLSMSGSAYSFYSPDPFARLAFSSSYSIVQLS